MILYFGRPAIGRQEEKKAQTINRATATWTARNRPRAVRSRSLFMGWVVGKEGIRPTTEHRNDCAPPCGTTGHSPKKYVRGLLKTPHQAHACSLLLGGGPYPNTETPLGARRPIANVECSQAGIGIARAIPIRSHFLGSCGRNVALVQYLIGPMSGKTVTRFISGDLSEDRPVANRMHDTG